MKDGNTNKRMFK
jgi:hypothetical protein